jgi:transcriptional regulator with XRE-family HTH domain
MKPLDIKIREEILSSKLRLAREEQNRERAGKHSGYVPMTQKWVAGVLKVSQGLISKIESGKLVPTFLVVEKLAALYNMELKHLSTLPPDERRASNHLNKIE